MNKLVVTSPARMPADRLAAVAVLLLAALALVLVVTPARPAAAQYEPPGTIAVSPVAPPPGATITVTVTGCRSDGGPVTITIDGAVVGSATPDADATFSADVVVPDTAGGDVEVVAACDSGLLRSTITVRIGDLPFDPPEGDDEAAAGDGALPRTGSSTTGPLTRIGAVLLGAGALLMVVARRRTPDEELVQAT